MMTGKKTRLSARALFVSAAVLLLLGGTVAIGLYVLHLDRVIRQKFDGKRWALPAVVYARPLELSPGLAYSPATLEDELQRAGYRRDAAARDPGGYDLAGDVMHLVTRDFTFPDGSEQSARITVEFAGRQIRRIVRRDTGAELDLLRLDPARIGSFHPRENEDRILVQREDLSDLLVGTLLAVEDQHFFRHIGIDPLGILRAFAANIRAGRTVQGGSTLTQQLVKNFYLHNQRTWQRKFVEMIMALLLELHYSKDEILTAYANEIYLGQDRGRAIHGFALASQFYFRRDLRDLSPAQVALLVGMIRGPSWYDPRREPERCLERQRVVLKSMRSEKVITDDAYQQARAAGLEKAENVQSVSQRYPAFLELVRRQLGEQYREDDLVSNGLKIFTTLDPQVQRQVEDQLRETLSTLEKRPATTELEGAAVVCGREGGEILALTGGRDPLQPGFNRAMDARRPIGSLIKPVVYLTALLNGSTLATPVQDSAVTVRIPGGKDWRPANYDKKEHGVVPLSDALAFSYNLSTVRIGMEIGVAKVVETLRQMGIEREFPPYPSFLLGTAELSPLEVTQVYQVLASGGFFQPLRAINAVMTAENSVLQQFPLRVEQRFPPESVYLLNTALKQVVSHGTARSLSNFLGPAVQAAGKTGTTDDLRDSWFAGFTGDRLAVVWVGRDDNASTGLTGASGAMVAWGRIMRNLPQLPLELPEPERIEWGMVDTAMYDAVAGASGGKVRLPFVSGTVPGEAIMAPPPIDQRTDRMAKPWETIRGWFR